MAHVGEIMLEPEWVLALNALGPSDVAVGHGQSEQSCIRVVDVEASHGDNGLDNMHTEQLSSATQQSVPAGQASPRSPRSPLSTVFATSPKPCGSSSSSTTPSAIESTSSPLALLPPGVLATPQAFPVDVAKPEGVAMSDATTPKDLPGNVATQEECTLSDAFSPGDDATVKPPPAKKKRKAAQLAADDGGETVTEEHGGGP